MNELLWIGFIFINFILITLSYRFFGKTGLFTWMPIASILANIQVLKTVELFGIVATLGNITYSSSFLVTDILNENYGKKDATKAVWIGFFSLIVMVIIMTIAIWFVPHESDFAHESIKTIFSIMPRIAIASLLAYIISQKHDVWAYQFWKKKFNKIWIQNNLSTMISQLIDSSIFTVIAFYGVFEPAILWQIFITTYILKWIVAAADTPFVYFAKKIK